jgi:proline iminopeptidase
MTTVDLPSGRTFVAECGEGRPIVVLHGGLGLDHAYLRPAFDRLADRFRLVYFDFLGNGRSEREIDYGSLHDNELWVRQIGELIAALQLTDPVLAGHSYGGYVALEYAIATGARLPLALISTSASLKHGPRVVENAKARGTPDQIAAVVEGLARPQPDDVAWEALWRRLLPLYFHAPAPELTEAAGARVRYSARGFNAAHLQVVPGYDVSDRLDRISGPCLVLVGDDDWILPLDICSLPLAAGIPGAALAVLPTCGHFPFLEKPELFHAILGDWLAGLPV